MGFKKKKKLQILPNLVEVRAESSQNHCKHSIFYSTRAGVTEYDQTLQVGIHHPSPPVNSLTILNQLLDLGLHSF